ncbi:MAG: DUF2851 family protein, partial [Kiritimatiellae bacterium]|nr:DUF2851 family protein [Kiritimatiellia bacterium]
MTDGWYSLDGGGGWPCAVREGAGGGVPPGLKERHLQCLWADDRWRPAGLKDSRGRPVEVVHPGEWNTGAGPDFLNALVKVGDETLHGDVEVHIRAQDWTRHGHGGDPRYGQVRVHVTYETGTLPDGALPAGCAQVALKPALDAAEDFSFDNMDPTAYPTGARAEPPPCQAAMRALPSA